MKTHNPPVQGDNSCRWPLGSNDGIYPKQMVHNATTLDRSWTDARVPVKPGGMKITKVSCKILGVLEGGGDCSVVSRWVISYSRERLFRGVLAVPITRTSRSFAIPRMFGSTEMSLTLHGAYDSYVET
jgi:hypothetical protein